MTRRGVIVATGKTLAGAIVLQAGMALVATIQLSWFY